LGNIRIIGLIILLYSVNVFSAKCDFIETREEDAYRYYIEAKKLVEKKRFKDALDKIYKASNLVFPNSEYISAKLKCKVLKPGPYAPIVENYTKIGKKEYNLKKLMRQILKNKPPLIYSYTDNRSLNICYSSKSKLYLKHLSAFDESFSLKPGECIKIDIFYVNRSRYIKIKEKISGLFLLDLKISDFREYYEKIMEELK